MNERIRKLAKEAEEYAEFYAAIADELERDIFVRRFAELVAAAEREACAKVCEDLVAQYNLHSNFICARTIRARGGE